MALSMSPIWRALPGDITEHILSLLVSTHFHTDPAYTWTTLRHLSAHQKRVIEHRFARFWLPRLSITLYAGVRHKIEYALDQTSTPTPPPSHNDAADDGDDKDKVVFAVQRQVHNPLLGVSQDSRPGKLAARYLRRAWEQYDPAVHRNITVRLGEGFLSGGCRGGYILNDTDLPGLEVLAGNGNKIRFCWKGAVDELFREEMFMRRVGEQMVCLLSGPGSGAWELC
jgi:hypothetical protein